MKKILISITILLFSTVVVYAEKQKCRELKIGKAYFNCLKGKLSRSSSASKEENNDNRNWYQKIKDGKPLLSK